MTTRLATIQKIWKLKNHENADNLEVAHVLGWRVVVKKGEFKEGDLCVYVALDSIMPERPEFAFLEKVKYRIKTCRLRGVLSQGICFPLSIIPPHYYSWTDDKPTEGDDLTDCLGVTKYEKPVPKNQDAIGFFPTNLLSKTDEERIQNFPELIEQFKDKKIYVTVKHDGTSATYIKTYDDFLVCSRSQILADGNNVYWDMARKYNLNDIPTGYAIQCEIIGPKIQSNPEGLKSPEIRVFNVVRLVDKELLPLEAMKKFCQLKNFPTAQILKENVDWSWNSIEDLLDFADSVKYNNGRQAEGIVIRPTISCYSETLGRNLSTKVISNKYALKHGE